MAADSELFYRTEDLNLDEVLDLYVETQGDRDIVDSLKSRSPVILRGSRGVGKSFLLRVAEAELKREFADKRVLPVYITFSKAAMLKHSSLGPLPWMTARITKAIGRALTSYGLSLPDDSALSRLAVASAAPARETIEEAVIREYEEFWVHRPAEVDLSAMPDADILRESIEDLCDELGLARVSLFIDEAAHVFVPEQQRAFFTLMRDLRSSRVSVKAAVYPGATSYGESFQPSHDATLLDVERQVSDSGYAGAMRQIVLKQDPSGRKLIEQYGEAFDVLAYASMGNPRVLLKTYATSKPFNRSRAQETLRNYYREGIWSEHSNLAERYPGHRELIDWGRSFMEKDVLPALHARNASATEMSSAIWIHRDAPQTVREALSLLCYSGVLQEGVSGIRATRSEVGTRYLVNLGCNFAQDREPIQYGSRVRSALSVKRMQEFGANHSAFGALHSIALSTGAGGENRALERRLGEGLDSLDLTHFQKTRLKDLGLVTIGDVLNASEENFKTLHYVGNVRARQMRNAAVTAVVEYLSG